MPRRIPEDIVEGLRKQADIVEIVGSYVSLRRQGQNYSGLCPFHQEKTPSFVVSPAKQIYHCFGCGKGGNAFTFLMEHEGVSFQEAVEKLAQRYGVQLPEEEASPQQRQQEARAKRLRQINQWAMEIYQEALASGVGAPGREYCDGRGLSDSTIRQFRLGYAPGQREYLTKRLLERQAGEQELIQLGLTVRQANGALTDRFWGRLMFPILDERDQVSGFGGRVVGEGTPKYLNSQETPLFHKGRVLYGLSAAKAAIRQQDQAIIMEGYMDVLAAWQHGVTNAVASLGTSLTADQAKLLTYYSYRTIICYDGDAAGAAAALRGLDLLDQQGCNVGVMRIPAGEDPDDFLRHYGKEPFLQLVSKAYSLFDYKFMLHMEQHDPGEMSGKVAIIQETMPDLARVRSAVARHGHIAMMADALQFPEQAIRDELQRYFGGYTRGGAAAPTEQPDTHARSGEETAQSIVIKSLMQDAGKQSDIEEAGGEALFAHQPAKDLYQTLSALYQAGYSEFTGDYLVTIIDREEERHWLTGILLEDPYPGDEEKAYRDSLLTLRRQWYDRRIDRAKAELDSAVKSGNVTAANEKVMVYQGLLVEKQKISYR
ncbi:MAG: DNA primase [Clostridiales bacterium]|nr:DNA primase [Clostridiales bacterium]